MLDIKFVRENPDKVKEGCKKKKVKVDIDRLLRIDKECRKFLKQLENMRAELNKLSKKKPDDKGRKKAKDLKTKIKSQQAALKDIKKDFLNLLLKIPNLPLDDVPVGESEKDNKVIRKWGKIPKFNFKPKDHIELGKTLDIIDIKHAAEISGARFSYLKNEAALLEFALINYTFKVLTSKKIIKKIADSIEKNYSDKIFIPIVPPVMIRPEVYTKMGRLSEEDKNERYYLPMDNLYLTGSAEHTLGPLHMNEIIKEKDLPKRYVGFSTCFRREAGSYGKDTRGILRVHQFDKIEMESFTTPENSLKEQEFFIAIQEYLMQSLKIPYQIVIICTGDMGDPDAKQIDIESWVPSQNKYRETHTADLVTDYQARRLNTKVKLIDGKTEFVHMNDATAFAIGRTLIAIIENYQQKDGKVKIPEVLQKYLGFKFILTK